MSTHSRILDAADDIESAIEKLDTLPQLDRIGQLRTYVGRLAELQELIHNEGIEQHFIHMLRAEPEDGYGLVDDGTMDTVLSCPKCNGWLRFDGREPAIMFLEDDRECWLCPEGDAP